MSRVGKIPDQFGSETWAVDDASVFVSYPLGTTTILHPLSVTNSDIHNLMLFTTGFLVRWNQTYSCFDVHPEDMKYIGRSSLRRSSQRHWNPFGTDAARFNRFRSLRRSHTFHRHDAYAMVGAHGMPIYPLTIARRSLLYAMGSEGWTRWSDNPLKSDFNPMLEAQEIYEMASSLDERWHSLQVRRHELSTQTLKETEKALRDALGDLGEYFQAFVETCKEHIKSIEAARKSDDPILLEEAQELVARQQARIEQRLSELELRSVGDREARLHLTNRE